MSAYYVGGEGRHYEPEAPEDYCPCADAGLVECYCGGLIGLSEAREWLVGQGVLDAFRLYADEIIAEVEARHPEKFAGWYDETLADKASERLRGPDYSAIVGRAA